jgi:hypothetical protein
VAETAGAVLTRLLSSSFENPVAHARTLVVFRVLDAIDGKTFLAGHVRIDDIVLAAIIVRRAVHAACLAIKGLTSALEVSGA